MPACSPASSGPSSRRPSPVDAAAVLAALKDIRGKQTQVVIQGKGAGARRHPRARSWPTRWKAYEQATAAVEFQAKGGNDGANPLAEWRKQNGDLLRDKAFHQRVAAGTRLHQPDVAALHGSQDEGPASRAVGLHQPGHRQLRHFLAAEGDRQAVARRPCFRDVFPDRTIHQQPAGLGTAAVRRGRHFSRRRSCPNCAGQGPASAGLLGKQDPTEAVRIDKQANGLAVNKFNTIRRPTLLWNRAEDELVLGRPGPRRGGHAGAAQGAPRPPGFRQVGGPVDGSGDAEGRDAATRRRPAAGVGCGLCVPAGSRRIALRARPRTLGTRTLARRRWACTGCGQCTGLSPPGRTPCHAHAFQPRQVLRWPDPFPRRVAAVNRGERIGLVGPNGAGKSTLFSIILKENSPDEGQVILERGASLGFLPQESAPAGDETVLALATSHEEDEYAAMSLQPKAKRILAGLAFKETISRNPRGRSAAAG